MTPSKTVLDAVMLGWKLGGSLTLACEFIAAFDSKRGNTISEKFDRLPLPAKFFIILAVGCVIGHWCWPLPAREEAPTA